MEASRFDQMLADSFGDVGSLSSQKEQNVESMFEDKMSRIEPQPARIQTLEDGDSGTFMEVDPVTGENVGFRQQGLDTYETYHPDKYNSEGLLTDYKDRNRMERQRKRYATQFNKPYSEVTNEDIYEQGAKKGLENLNRMAQQPGDSPWEAGPTDYYRNHELQLGTKETPLDLAVNKLTDGNRGKFGRELVDIQNPQTGVNVNEAGLTGYNSAEYTNEGKFDKSLSTMDNINVLAEKNGVTPAKAAEMILFGSADENDDGRVLSNILTIGSGTAHILANVMDYGAEKVADAAIALGVDDEAGMKATKDFWNKDGKIMKYFDEKMNLNKGYSQRATQEMMAEIEAGNYGSAALSVLENLDVHLAQSAPEMLAIAAGAPVLALAITGRVQDNIENFRKANGGQEPTAAEEAAMFATNSAVLLAEKALLKGPMKKLVSKMAGRAGGTFSQAARGTLMSATGETAQEIADQAQQQYWDKGGSGLDKGTEALTTAVEKFRKGEVISANEAIGAGIAGGVMGGALRGGGEVLATPGRIAKNSRTKREEEVGEYLVGEDADFASALDDMSFKDTEDFKKNTYEAADDIDNYNSIEEMLDSPNPEIRRVARNMQKKADAEVETGSTQHHRNIARRFANEGKNIAELTGQDRADAQSYVDEVKDFIGIDITKSTKEEVLEAINSIEDQKTKDFLYENMSAETTKPTLQEIESEYSGGFEGFKKKTKEAFENNKKIADLAIAQKEELSKNFEKGKERAPKEKEVVVDEDYRFTHGETGKTITGKVIDTSPNGVKTVEFTNPDGSKDTAAFDKNGNGIHDISSGNNVFHGNGRGKVNTKKVAGLRGGKLDAKLVEKKTKRKGLKRLLDTLTLNNRGKKDAMREINKYTPEALEEALKDSNTSERMKKIIKDVQAKRKRAAKAGNLNKNTGVKVRGTNLKKGDKKGTLDLIKKSLSQKDITDTRDVEAIDSLIDSALEQGFITDKHAEIFKNRLGKIGKNAVAPTDEQLEAEEKALEKEKEETGFGEKTMENLKNKTEVTKEDLEEEATELNKDVNEFLQKNKKKYYDIKDKKEEDRTEEESKFIERYDHVFNNKVARARDVKKQLDNFSKQEIATNDAHTVLEEEWFYEDATVYNGEEISEAFTEEEKKILGIC